MAQNLMNKQFGHLFVISKTNNKKFGCFLWECKCDCGKIAYIPTSSLTSGNTKSCGCRQGGWEYKKKHDGKGTRIYRIWMAMRERCKNINHYGFRWYGGKGISVCRLWNDFTKFKNWALESGYKDYLTIDRINSDKGYLPCNCQWITQSENSKKANAKKFI